MKTKLLSIIILGLFITEACKLLGPGPDEFTLQRKDYTGNELRIDGYYYDGCRVQLFYKNGIHLYGGGCHKENELKELETIFSNGTFHDAIYDDETSWGVFIIENDTIKFERYNPPSGPGYMHSFIREGPIINDTTFRIVRIYRYEDGVKKVTETNDLYHFKKFSPKPDSINNFIK